jgi:transposase
MHVEPKQGEALCSWLARLSNRLALTPPDTAACVFALDNYRRPNWWRRPGACELAAIANKTGLTIERLRGMTLAGWAEARNDERHQRFGAPGFLRQRAQPKALQPLAICGQCMASDDEPFIRTEWMIGWTVVCMKHRAVLNAHCPSCGAVLTLPGINTRRRVIVGRCGRCDRPLDGSHAEPAPDAICQLQAQLLAVKRDGTGNLPGIGRIAWATLVGLVDLVLAALWRPRARHARERLFARVVRDSGLDPEERLRIDWPSNYGTMLILGWLFAGWAERMTEAMDLLRAPALGELIRLVTEIGGAPDCQLGTILVDVILDRPAIEEEWRRWLESLPETGDTLRQRNRRELRHGVSERLRALADLRDGMDAATVAAKAGLRIVTVERWLDIGLEYGLEALTAEQMRISALTQKQRHAITTWLASISRRSKGPNAWRAEQAQQEIAVRFGVLISVSAVLHLFQDALRLRFDGALRRPSSGSRFKERVHV